MATKIDQDIVKVMVVKPEDVKKDNVKTDDNVQFVSYKLERPERLAGSTYKIKTPLSPHSIYVTINDIILNEGTPHESLNPYEIFISSKSMEHFQWIVALTRVISAVFRKGGEISFLVDELMAVFDPKAGYYKKGGQYMPSLYKTPNIYSITQALVVTFLALSFIFHPCPTPQQPHTEYL